MIFVIWVLVSFISSLSLMYEGYFTVTGFFGTAIRILVSLSLMLCLPLWLRTEKNKFAVANSLSSVVIFHSFVQLLFVALFYLNKAPFLNLVPHGDQSNRQHWLNIYDYTFYTRFGGVFEEPSWYSWFMVACLGLIIAYEIHNKVTLITKKKWLVILLALFFTYSIAGIASVCILLAYKVLSGNGKAKLQGVVLASISIPTIVLLNPDSALLNRIIGILSGNDGSSNTRIFDAFSKLKVILSNNLSGTGIGNSLEGILYYDHAQQFNITSTQNGYVEAFVSTGLIGGAIFMVPFIYFMFEKKYRLSLITMTLVFFTTSALFIVVMWFFMSLSYYLYKKPRNEKKSSSALT
ncbi:O-antigen ligase family protein [Pseudoalteromonas sp. AOP31-A2-14]